MNSTMKDARELAKAFRDMERMEALTPSDRARAIVRARSERSTRESLNAAARDMGISARELAGDIIAERTFLLDAATVKPVKEYEAGITLAESSERRSLAKAMIHAEHATRPDYRESRELLSAIGRDKGAVISSVPTGMITVSAVFRAVDKDYATAMMAGAIANWERARSRVTAAELAIETDSLTLGTPAMQAELANSQRALNVASKRWERANQRVADSQSVSADGLRLEIVTQFPAGNDVHAESIELPPQIIRRPFRDVMRPRIRRAPISPVECAVLRNESDAERAIVRAQIALEIATVIASKSTAELAEIGEFPFHSTGIAQIGKYNQNAQRAHR